MYSCCLSVVAILPLNVQALQTEGPYWARFLSLHKNAFSIMLPYCFTSQSDFSKNRARLQPLICGVSQKNYSPGSEIAKVADREMMATQREQWTFCQPI